MQSGALLRRLEYGAEDELDSVSYKETFHGKYSNLDRVLLTRY
jgi:hypothetical protein